ncbi:hypothetical protein [Corynebacterium glyciniphilum]|uniref:hypothetical protein n=1 Tax=Corynebacterium glyciniphilum TaxID=1404244 RepID=UPI003FD11FBD
MATPFQRGGGRVAGEVDRPAAVGALRLRQSVQVRSDRPAVQQPANGMSGERGDVEKVEGLALSPTRHGDCTVRRDEPAQVVDQPRGLTATGCVEQLQCEGEDVGGGWGVHVTDRVETVTGGCRQPRVIPHGCIGAGEQMRLGGDRRRDLYRGF